METISFNMDLEHYIDQQLYKCIGKKGPVQFNTKLNNSMSKGVVYGVRHQSMVLLHLTCHLLTSCLTLKVLKLSYKRSRINPA